MNKDEYAARLEEEYRKLTGKAEISEDMDKLIQCIALCLEKDNSIDDCLKVLELARRTQSEDATATSGIVLTDPTEEPKGNTPPAYVEGKTFVIENRRTEPQEPKMLKVKATVTEPQEPKMIMVKATVTKPQEPKMIRVNVTKQTPTDNK